MYISITTTATKPVTPQTTPAITPVWLLLSGKIYTYNEIQVQPISIDYLFYHVQVLK